MRARVLDIYAKYGEYIKAIVPLKIEDEYMKIIIYLSDDTTLEACLEDVMEVIIPALSA